MKYKMEDVLEALIDYRGKTPRKSETGIPTLSAKSVKDGYIDYSSCYYISPEEYQRFMVRGFPKVGDVLLTTEAPMGNVARLDREDIGIAQRLLTLRGKKDVCDTDYLRYWLKSPCGKAALSARETGTTVTGIKQAEFRKIVIDLPDIETQKKVVSVLLSLERKLEVNNEINKNLPPHPCNARIAAKQCRQTPKVDECLHTDGKVSDRGGNEETAEQFSSLLAA